MVNDNGNKIPNKIDINGAFIDVKTEDEYELMDDVDGDFDNVKKLIRLHDIKNEVYKREVFMHEVIHGIEDGMKTVNKLPEENINIIALDIMNVMTENRVCIHPETIDDNEKIENGCFFKKNGIISLQDCTLDVAGANVKVSLVDRKDINYPVSNSFYVPLKREIRVGIVPEDAEAENIGFFHGLMRSINDIENLGIEETKINYFAQHIYKTLKENKLCFRKKQ